MAKRVELSVKLPEKLKHWVDVQVELGNYKDAGACVADALRQQAAQTPEEIEAVVLRADKRGGARPMTDRDWSNLHKSIDRTAEVSREIRRRARKSA